MAIARLLTRVRRAPLHISPLKWEHINLTGDYHWRKDAGLQDGRRRGRIGHRLALVPAVHRLLELGGHLVSGHVDGTGHVSHFEQVGESWELRITAPTALAKYLAYKGSITVNGVSLTVNQVEDHLSQGALQNSEISINLIPHTVENTALGSLKTGSAVNLEIDTVARYVERMLHVEKLLETNPVA